MKRTFLLLTLAAAAAVADDSKVIRLSEPVATTESAEIFGAPLNEEAKPILLATLLSEPDAHLGEAVRVDTRVTEVCQRKGCFYLATDGERQVRVSFKDYGFFVPTDIGGKTVTLTGVLIERELSEDEAAHFRDDTDSDVIRAGKTYELVADAVSVPTTG